MKNFIFALSLWFGGLIGFVGWAIACTAKVDGGVSRVFSCVRGMDGVILAFFAILALIGLIWAYLEMKKG